MPLTGWKEKLFRRYLSWKCRPARCRDHLFRTITTGRAAPLPVEGRVRAAAFQLEIKLLEDPLLYVDEMHSRVRQAAEAGAHLAVFPENNNLQLLGLLPGVEKIGDNSRGGEEKKAVEQQEEITLGQVIRYLTPVVWPLIHSAFSILAVSYGIYIMAGSFLLAKGPRVVNRAYLFSPRGKIAGCQDKVHLMPVEEEWGISRGGSFSVLDTELGKLALPVCMDATYYETFRILERLGAEIAMVPIANPEPYNYWLALRGIWPRVQESPLFGIKSAMVGSLAGFTFTGRAGIFAPMELAPCSNGILAEVNNPEKEGMALAQLDLTALRKLRADHPWRDTNELLYKKYFPGIYSWDEAGHPGKRKGGL